jgi:hypothetical protein
MPKADPLAVHASEAVNRFILRVSLPLLSDGTQSPKILGTGTLFRIDGRVFLVTAAHLLKEDPEDSSSNDIDFTAIAFPSRPIAATLQTLGSFEVIRPAPQSNIDVVVLELKTPETIAILERGWDFLNFDNTGMGVRGTRFILSGYLFEGVRFDGTNIGQAMLTLTTDFLDYVPAVTDPAPSVDQFYYLEDQGTLIDGTTRRIPHLKGLSGASIWSYVAPSPPALWDPSTALHVVAVQSSAKRGHWFRGVDWAAVREIFRDPKVGLKIFPT